MTILTFQPHIGDICSDGTGLKVKVKDIDMYAYVHFCPIEGREENESLSAQMSCVAFVRRFRRIGQGNLDRKAA